MDRLREEARSWWHDRYRGPLQKPADLLSLVPQLRQLTGEKYGLFQTPVRSLANARRALWQFFRKRGVNPRTSPLANAHYVLTARKSLSGHEIVTVSGNGFDFEEPRAAEALSLVESLERLFALFFCEPERVVHRAYREIAPVALHANTFPLYAEQQYQEPGFPLSRFDPEGVSPWVWGVKLTTGDPVLVPFDLVFGSSSPGRIYKANSNGAACHSSLHHALVNGLYEVVERDALMVVWMNRMSRPRIRFAPSDPDPWSVRSTLAGLGLELEHVDITTDLGIPVILGVLRDRQNPDFFMVSMVAHIDPRERLEKLYRALAQSLCPYLIDHRRLINDCTPEPDAARVSSFDDHIGFYQSREKNRHAAFLTAAPAEQGFGQDVHTGSVVDIQREADLLVARLGARGYEVIVVDCTTPMLSGLGLYAVKVIIPGLQPLNAGHRLRCLGGERVVTVAQHMGMADRRKPLTELNPWPHPFW